jgi:protein TonB
MARVPPPCPERSAAVPAARSRGAAAYAASAALHLAALVGLARLPPPPLPRPEAVAVDIVSEAPSAAIAPPPETPPPAPLPEPPAPRRVPRKIVQAPRGAPPAAAADAAPPPPNAPPPPDAPPAARAPVRIGVSMSATTQGGTFSAPVGNTLYGEVPKGAPDAKAVRPYQADRYVPPTQVRRLPRAVACEIPQAEYPEAARRAGVEGKVRLRVLVGADGRVLEVQVLEEPGHGLGAAAVAGVKRHCRFAPGEGESGPAATWIPYTVRWELE